MSRVVKVNHVILTLKVSPHGQGEERDEIDRKINARLQEGYDTVEIFPIKTNLDERQQVTDYVFMYFFKRYSEEPHVKSKKDA